MQTFWHWYHKIQQDKQYQFTALSVFCVALLYANISSSNSSFIGTVLTIVYMLIVSIWLAKVLAKLFSWTRGWSFIFSIFVVINILSLALAIPVDLYLYTDGILIMVLLVVVVLARVLLMLPKVKDAEIEAYDTTLSDPLRKTYEPHKYLLLLLPVLIGFGLWLLLSVRTGEFILSPWSVVPRLYLYLYLLITASVLLLIFSQRSAKVLLLVVIAHSFLLHAYLPFVYETGFGGDKWRHLASVNLIKTGEIYQPALIGDVEYAQILGVEVPAVWVTGNKTSYGQQWSLVLLVSQMLQVDEFWVDFWLVFFMWSIFMPLLLYKLAFFIRPGRQFALLFAFLPALFYPLQVFGAITLPVSIGQLLFVFVLLAWLYYLRDGKGSMLTFSLLFSVLMFFGYVLHFLVIWEIAALVMVYQCCQHFKLVQLRKWLLGILVVAFIMFIPLLETIQGFGSVKSEVLSFGGAFSALADAFGYLTGIVAFLPQSGHVDQGNFLFNQTRADHAPVSFLSFRLWPLIFTWLVWAVIALGYWVVRRLKDQKVPRLFMYMSLIVLGNYTLSWYFLNGNHILARRLDQIIVLFLSVFLALGITYFIERVQKIPWTTKVLMTSIVLAFVASSTYASGPFLQVVTKDEHEAAQYVWEQIDKSDDQYCVVANTWPLLAVEAESGRAIIGGGFPVGFEYAQPERVKIFEKMSQYPDEEWLDWALEITKDDSCYFMQEDRWINDRVYADTIDLLGQPEKVIGDVYIWQYSRE